jgi:uncharacterized protein YndB with AHSA1/START domain
MSESPSEQVVKKSIIIAQNVEMVFRMWTEAISVWWPAGHSISGDLETQVFLEGKVGGRFYERTPEGVEHDWGAVEVWEPPNHLTFRWYLGSDQTRPTLVDLQFVPLDKNRTRIDLEHHGPELIGELWQHRAHIFTSAWDKVLSSLDQFHRSRLS